MIPKILHQVWIGPRPQPTEYIDQWRDLCARYGWEHRLWTDDHVEQEVRFSRDVYDRVARLYHMVHHRANLYRLEVLYRHGGVYIDLDYLPNGVDPARYIPIHQADLVSSTEHHFPEADWWENVHDPYQPGECPAAIVVQSAFLASSPRHPQVRYWIEMLAGGYARRMEIPIDQNESLAREDPLRLRWPSVAFCLSRHLRDPLTIVPYSCLTGHPDAFARCVSYYPPQCYTLAQWQNLKREYAERGEQIPGVHPEELQDAKDQEATHV